MKNQPTNIITKKKVEWGYEGDISPPYWGTLCPTFSPCSEGKSQSPIDITGVSPQKPGGITFNYQPTKLNIVNNGHSIMVSYDEGSYIEVDGTQYNLVQFHFHAPGEHTFDGKNTEMEMHLVHKDIEGNLAVVGIMMKAGAENPLLAQFWDNFPEELSEINLEQTINVAELSLTDSPYYSYDGSLTTPPCSEGVQWFVMEKQAELSKAQLDRFTSIIGENARPIQPLNDRKLQEGNELKDAFSKNGD